MSKKQKLKKTLVEQILDKAKIEHTGLAINALESNSLPVDISRSDIYKTLALIGDKTGPVIGILPLTEPRTLGAIFMLRPTSPAEQTIKSCSKAIESMKIGNFLFCQIPTGLFAP